MPEQTSVRPGTVRTVIGRGRIILIAIVALTVTGAALLGVAAFQAFGPPDTATGEPVPPIRPAVAASPRVPADTVTPTPTPTPSPSPEREEDRLPPPERRDRDAEQPDPVRLEIDSIDVNSKIMNLGLADDRTIEVPPFSKADRAGWYDRSPTPGEDGPSIVVGHIDAPSGPAVFYRLAELDRGDRIRIHRSDGSTAVFAVRTVETVSKDHFPTRKVYGNLDYPGLRLITCGGVYDRSAGGYQSNTIAYAALVAVNPGPGQ